SRPGQDEGFNAGGLGRYSVLVAGRELLHPLEQVIVQLINCQFAEYLYRLRGIFCWKSRGFQGEGSATTTSGGIMVG
ncbi:MAG: hypothetical protein WBC80_24775, partial [Isosphaeraceae bacterium]